jgi:hypothetical protein
LSSFAPRENPGEFVGTTNAEIPLCLECEVKSIVTA